MTALEVKAGVLARATPRKQATIEGLWRVLEAMGKKGVRVFTVANVAKACEDAGVMRTSTIYNAGGADYRALIKAFAEGTGAGTAHVVGRSSSPLEEAIASIKDLDVRTKLRAVLAENKNHQLESDRLRAAMKHMRLAEPPAAGASPEPDASPALQLGRVDLVPLQKFLSSDWLADNHWSVDANGAIVTADGDRVTPVGFAPALSHAIAALSGNGRVAPMPAVVGDMVRTSTRHQGASPPAARPETIGT